MGLSSLLPRPAFIATATLTAMLGLVAAAHGAGLIIGNGTMSVRPGLYYRSDPDTAIHVTFCVSQS